jgi:hypothetical protein
VKLKISAACAAAGVALLVLAALLPERWYPMIPLFVGLALLAVSHVLTPCQDQITKWWRRIIERKKQDDAGSLHG